MQALIHVPVEISQKDAGDQAPRWFRLSMAISPESVRLRSALPEELHEGPLRLRLHLPYDDGTEEARAPLNLTGVAAEVVVDEGEATERAEVRLVQLRGLDDRTRDRIMRYMQHRLDSAAAGG